MESHWIRHHKKTQTPPYVPKVEPAPIAEADDADHELLPDRGPASLSDEDIVRASVDPDDPRVEIASLVMNLLNNYTPKKGA